MRISEWLWRAPRPIPVDTVTVMTCVACGEEVSEWFTVLWQRERGMPHGDVQPVEGDSIRTWCVPCGTAVEKRVRRAVINAPLGGPAS